MPGETDISARRPHLALMLGGGGARAAYQVGVLRAFARRRPDLMPDYLTGVSAGAINVSYLANSTERFARKVEGLTAFWKGIETSDIFRAGPLALLSRVLRAGLKLTVGLPAWMPGVTGMVDTRPLRRLLHSALSSKDGTLPAIDANIAAGRLRGVALTTYRYGTGQTVTFFDGDEIDSWERPRRKSVKARLTVDHVMASAALPLLFPPVRLDGDWYGDGGIGLTAPLAPAVHMGADRILVVSTHYQRSREEAERPIFSGPPSPAMMMGTLYNAIFHDRLDQDVLHLERVTRLIFGLSPSERRGLRPIELLVIRPSRDIGLLAGEYEPDLPPTLRYLLRRFGTIQSRTQDFTSTILFQPAYIQRLIQLGEEDGARHAEDLAAFVAGDVSPPAPFH